MLAEGLSQTEIAKHFGTYQANVRYYCVKYDLTSKWTKRNALNRELREQKQCSGCDEIRHVNDYDKDPRASDGLSSKCKICRSIEIKKWQMANRDRTRLASNGWKERNPEKVRAYSAKYWAKNKEICKAKRKAWITPKRMSYYSRLRRDRKRGAEGHCSFTQLQARIDYYGGLCWICGDPMQAIDHVKPLAKGGTEWPANLRPICTSCNSRKRDLWPYPECAILEL
jgi:5-methylcytosine-specific restriction endonuclease McrA